MLVENPGKSMIEQNFKDTLWNVLLSIVVVSFVERLQNLIDLPLPKIISWFDITKINLVRAVDNERTKGS